MAQLLTKCPRQRMQWRLAALVFYISHPSSPLHVAVLFQSCEEMVIQLEIALGLADNTQFGLAQRRRLGQWVTGLRNPCDRADVQSQWEEMTGPECLCVQGLGESRFSGSSFSAWKFLSPPSSSLLEQRRAGCTRRMSGRFFLILPELSKPDI